jgi:hypothetical protein
MITSSNRGAPSQSLSDVPSTATSVADPTRSLKQSIQNDAIENVVFFYVNYNFDLAV